MGFDEGSVPLDCGGKGLVVSKGGRDLSDGGGVTFAGKASKRGGLMSDGGRETSDGDDGGVRVMVDGGGRVT